MLDSRGDIMGLYNRIAWLLNGLIQFYNWMGLSSCTTGFPAWLFNRTVSSCYEPGPGVA